MRAKGYAKACSDSMPMPHVTSRLTGHNRWVKLSRRTNERVAR
jgi:hypothetical protein